ncbi:MAG: PqiC family protein [Ghiorsea sp.]
MMKKYFILSLILITLVSCSSAPKDLYVLSTVKEPATKLTQKYTYIGVENIAVPQYLAGQGIPVAKNKNEIFMLKGAKWAEDLDVGLTQRLIVFLQKKFQLPTVYHYPWDTSKASGLRVRVEITRFIAHGDSVYLDANWQIMRLDSDIIIAKLFRGHVPVDLSSAATVVKAMDSAFGQLESQIAIAIQEI